MTNVYTNIFFFIFALSLLYCYVGFLMLMSGIALDNPQHKEKLKIGGRFYTFLT